MAFKFRLGDAVVIGKKYEKPKKGIVVGRAEFTDNSIQYLVQIVADGTNKPDRNWVYEMSLDLDDSRSPLESNDVPLPQVP